MTYPPGTAARPRTKTAEVTETQTRRQPPYNVVILNDEEHTFDYVIDLLTKIFRHSLATNLRAAGVDLKTAQELLRHANSRITLEVYTRAISATKREANDRVMQMVFEAEKKTLSAPSKTLLMGNATPAEAQLERAL